MMTGIFLLSPPLGLADLTIYSQDDTQMSSYIFFYVVSIAMSKDQQAAELRCSNIYVIWTTLCVLILAHYAVLNGIRKY